jgi:glycosyltransferase involved in cell wall biosynthesis
LRIVHALVAPGRGGAETMAIDLARAQRRAGHEVALVLLSRSLIATDAASAALPVTVAPVTSSIDLRGAGRAARAIVSFRPDVVHCHGGRPLVPVAWARARGVLGGLVIYTRHGDGLGRRHSTRRANAAVERLLFGAVDGVGCVNQELWAVDRARFARKPVELVVNGVDVEAFAPAAAAERAAIKTRLGLPSSALLVVCTSRLVPLKGVDVLVDAWGEVSNAVPAAHLVIAGEGECREMLVERVRRSGAAASVHFVGSIPSVAPLVRAADVFAFPSVQGCFGRSAIEALAAGTAVVASRLDGTERFVTDGETARLVAPGQSAPLAAVISSLLADEAARRSLGLRARALAEARYSVDGMALAYEALYARAAANGFTPHEQPRQAG